MTMNHAVHARVDSEHLPVDKSFRVAFPCIGVDGAGILDPILDQIIRTLDQCGRKISGHDIYVRILRVPNRDMTVRIDNVLIVEDMVCSYQLAFELSRKVSWWSTQMVHGAAYIGKVLLAPVAVLLCARVGIPVHVGNLFRIYMGRKLSKSTMQS